MTDLRPFFQSSQSSIMQSYLRCVNCGSQVGRHSKSLDIERKVCAKCRGRFELLVNHKSSAASATPGRRLDQVSEQVIG